MLVISCYWWLLAVGSCFLIFGCWLPGVEFRCSFYLFYSSLGCFVSRLNRPLLRCFVSGSWGGYSETEDIFESTRDALASTGFAFVQTGVTSAWQGLPLASHCLVLQCKRMDLVADYTGSRMRVHRLCMWYTWTSCGYQEDAFVYTGWHLAAPEVPLSFRMGCIWLHKVCNLPRRVHVVHMA